MNGYFRVKIVVTIPNVADPFCSGGMITTRLALQAELCHEDNVYIVCTSKMTDKYLTSTVVLTNYLQMLATVHFL